MDCVNRTALLSLMLTLSVAGSGGAWAASPTYRITQEVALGAPDKWDYVVFDPGSGRVFIAHSDRVSVVDGKTGARLGDVVGITGGTHGVAITPKGRGYTDDGDAGTVKSFDMKTLKVLGTIPAAPDADGMTFDPFSGHLFVSDGDSGIVSIIDPGLDPGADKILASVKIGAKLEYIVSDGAGKVYVNGAGQNQVIRIDVRSNAIDARWGTPGCESPRGLAIDTVRRRLFVSCVNARLVVMNADTGAQVATLPIGRGTDAAAYDPSHRRVFSPNGVDGTLTVIQQDGADAYRVLDTIRTSLTGRTLSVDPATGRLYIAAAEPDAAPPPGGKAKPKPGSLRLLFLDPVGE